MILCMSVSPHGYGWLYQASSAANYPILHSSSQDNVKYNKSIFDGSNPLAGYKLEAIQ